MLVCVRTVRVTMHTTACCTQAGAIEVDVEQLAVIASTFAARGVCPTTMEKVLEPSVVKTVMSHLYACGMKGVRLRADIPLCYALR